MVKKRRRHSAAFKFRGVLEAIEGSKTISQLPSEHEIRANLIRAGTQALSQSVVQVADYACQPSMECRHHLCATAARLHVPGGCHRLAQTLRARLAAFQHPRRHLLSRCSAPGALQGAAQKVLQCPVSNPEQPDVNRARGCVRRRLAAARRSSEMAQLPRMQPVRTRSSACRWRRSRAASRPRPGRPVWGAATAGTPGGSGWRGAWPAPARPRMRLWRRIAGAAPA